VAGTGGTLLILLRPILVRQSNSDRRQPNFAAWLWPVALVATFVVALYGGYFGAGIGILVISTLSFMGIGDIRQVVALKNLLTGCLRGVAVAVLVVEGTVDWGYALPMVLGGLVGGYLGGMVSKQVNQNILRIVVISIGFGVAAYYFWRLYGSTIMHVAGE
jgi:uncharacterized membrane protein YfcA